MGMFRDTHFVLLRSTSPQSKQFGLQETYTEFCGAVDVCIANYSEFPIILPRDLEGEYSTTATEKCNLFARLMDKDVETLDDHGWPKDQDLVEE